jgi:MarR family transcriptional regulator, lower aerobic nicotinate degradation pathway regulator
MRFDEPPPEPLASATGFLLSWNGRRTSEGFARVLEEVGLRPPIFGVLTLIDSRPGLTQKQLVEGSLIDASSMVAVLDELEASGLAERRPNESDRRKHAVYLTAKGKRTLAKAGELATAYAEDLLAPLDPDERETLRQLLRKLARVGDEEAAR